MVEVFSPEYTLSSKDAGDDMQRRIRYQAGYAAILSLQLIDNASEYDEIFCEHHEDVLIKRKDGRFIGVQVKTRLSGREAYRSDDTEIISSIVRFCELDQEYPGSFTRFVIATNHSFWAEDKDNGKNLHYVINTVNSIKEQGYSSLPKNVRLYVDKIIKALKLSPKDTNNQNLVLNVIRRITLNDDLPKFEDLDLRIAQTIPVYYSCKDASLDQLMSAANELINQSLRAGSLANVTPLRNYFSYCADPQRAKIASTIDGKRITISKTLSLLEKSINTLNLLQTREPFKIDKIPSTARVLDRKMVRGNISYQNIELTKDQKYSIETLLEKWLYKYGSVEANKKFNHLKAMVANECAEVYDEVKQDDDNFGTKMLVEVRKRLRSRYETQQHLFFDIQYEHLLGIAGILTELCEVWWSNYFDIKAES